MDHWRRYDLDMNCRSASKKYSEWEIPEENLRKLELSGQDIPDTDIRPIRCPKCSRIQFYAYGDCNTGHIDVLCPRCKERCILSFRYFHSSKNRRIKNAGYLIR